MSRSAVQKIICYVELFLRKPAILKEILDCFFEVNAHANYLADVRSASEKENLNNIQKLSNFKIGPQNKCGAKVPVSYSCGYYIKSTTSKENKNLGMWLTKMWNYRKILFQHPPEETLQNDGTTAFDYEETVRRQSVYNVSEDSDNGSFTVIVSGVKFFHEFKMEEKLSKLDDWSWPSSYDD